MILQALCEYYDRKGNLAPEGFGYVKIPFLIQLDKNGHFLSIIDTRFLDKKKYVGRDFLVPVLTSRSGKNPVPNLLWDTVEYVLGVPNSSDKKKSLDKQKDDAFRKFEAFKEKIVNQTFSNDERIQAVVKFLDNNPIQSIKSSVGEDFELWKIIIQDNPNISFCIEDDEQPLCSKFNQELQNSRDDSDEHTESICLISGKPDLVARIHPKIKGVQDAQSSGASLVSFNKPSFTSYDKDQNLNAPISKSAAFAYTTALNAMLAKDSQNKMRVGDATAVFWSAKKTEFESIFSAFWGYSKDNPDADVLAVKQLYNSINTGAKIPDSDTKFYVLGLSPNAARLSVRFWHTGTIAEFSNRIKQHFDDLEIVRPKNDSGHYSLFWMLSAIALEHKTENVPPNLNGEVVNSILAGTPYPTTLQHQCIRRIRAEQDVGRIRASLLKAYLNRRNRFYKSEEKELTVALDITNENIGYRLGRLFATFEKLQEDAQPGINATIKDRYYGAASSTPCTVFPQLFKLKNHHLAKLQNVGQKVNYEKLIGEITSSIPAEGVPAHLSLDDQSRFAIGYYHQRQEFFKAKEDK